MAGDGDVKPDISKLESGAAQADDNAPDVKPSQQSINIRVRDADKLIVQFKCKPTTPFEKLMKAYCSKQGQAVSAVKFLFDGGRVLPTDTPASLEMEDMDMVRCPVRVSGWNLQLRL